MHVNKYYKNVSLYMYEACLNIIISLIQLQRTNAISKRFVDALEKDGCCSTSCAAGPDMHLIYVYIYIIHNEL